MMSDTESELGSEEGNLNEGTASGSGFATRAGLMSIHLHLLLLLVCECPFSADQCRVRLKEEV